MSIKVSRDGKGFTRHNEPFFWLGDTGWPLIASYTPEDAEHYLQVRARQGFTVIQTVIAWGDPNPEISLEGTPAQANYAGQPVWLDNNPSTPNPGFFENLDRIIDLAEKLGLVLALFAVWGFNVHQQPIVNETNAFEYGAWLGERYQDRENIIWVIGGDRVPTGFERVWELLADGIRTGCGGNQLMTYHPCGAYSSSSFWHDAEWLDFNCIQTWSLWTKIHDLVLKDVLRQPRKPVVLAEPAYESGPEYPHGPITPLMVRRQAYSALFAGGFFTYGHDRMWRMGENFLDQLDSPGAEQMGVLGEIWRSLEWTALNPDPSLIADSASSYSHRPLAMSTDSMSQAVVYVPSRQAVCIQLDRFFSPSVAATWINPTSGERISGSIFLSGKKSGTAQSFPDFNVTQWVNLPSHWEDGILLLQAQSLG